MSFEREVQRLREYLDELAVHGDDGLARYEGWKAPRPPGLYWTLRWFVGRILSSLELLHLKRPDPWPVGLKQVAGSVHARPLLIWAVGTNKSTLRAACRSWIELSDDMSGVAPVLVTDVADFAYFSRLGWLVEYLPKLTGEGDPYEHRKVRFIARLYRHVPALPAHLLCDTESSRRDVRAWMKTT